MSLASVELLGIGLVLFFVGSIVFGKLNNHLLRVLICLEALILSLLVFLYNYIVNFESARPLFLVLLVFAASEAAIGLSLLVRMLRTRGNDYVTSFNTLNFYA